MRVPLIWLMASMMCSRAIPDLLTAIMLWRAAQMNGHSTEMRLLALSSFGNFAYFTIVFIALQGGVREYASYYPGWQYLPLLASFIGGTCAWPFIPYVIFKTKKQMPKAPASDL